MSMLGIFKDAAAKAGNFCWDNIRGGRLTLRDAIEKHDWEKAGAMLQQNPEAADWDLEDASPIKRKALHVAASSGDFQSFIILLRPEFFKGDIDVRDSQGATPLIAAAREGNDLIVQALITKGADVNAVDHLGRSALSCAAQNNRLASMKLLMDKGAAVNGPAGSRAPLGEAARMDMCLPAMKLLLERKAGPDHIGMLQESALQSCRGGRNVAGLHVLLDAGAKPNNPDTRAGAGLLCWAVCLNDAKAVKTLLARGADPLLKPANDAASALETAVSRGTSPDVRFMIEQAAAKLKIQRNISGVEKGMAAGTASPITVKPIKLRAP